jgi:hypothetical protein
MIDIGEFNANWLNTKANPIPSKAKISWENLKGEKRDAVLDLSNVPSEQDDGAVIIDIDEYDASVKYLDKQQFSGEWEKDWYERDTSKRFYKLINNKELSMLSICAIGLCYRSAMGRHL